METSITYGHSQSSTTVMALLSRTHEIVTMLGWLAGPSPGPLAQPAQDNCVIASACPPSDRLAADSAGPACAARRQPRAARRGCSLRAAPAAAAGVAVPVPLQALVQVGWRAGVSAQATHTHAGCAGGELAKAWVCCLPHHACSCAFKAGLGQWRQQQRRAGKHHGPEQPPAQRHWQPELRSSMHQCSACSDSWNVYITSAPAPSPSRADALCCAPALSRSFTKCRCHVHLFSFLLDLRPPALGGTHIHTPVEVLDVAASGGRTLPRATTR